MRGGTPPHGTHPFAVLVLLLPLAAPCPSDWSPLEDESASSYCYKVSAQPGTDGSVCRKELSYSYPLTVESFDEWTLVYRFMNKWSNEVRVGIQLEGDAILYSDDRDLPQGVPCYAIRKRGTMVEIVKVPCLEKLPFLCKAPVTGDGVQLGLQTVDLARGKEVKHNLTTSIAAFSIAFTFTGHEHPESVATDRNVPITALPYKKPFTGRLLAVAGGRSPDSVVITASSGDNDNAFPELLVHQGSTRLRYVADFRIAHHFVVTRNHDSLELWVNGKKAVSARNSTTTMGGNSLVVGGPGDNTVNGALQGVTVFHRMLGEHEVAVLAADTFQKLGTGWCLDGQSRNFTRYSVKAPTFRMCGATCFSNPPCIAVSFSASQSTCSLLTHPDWTIPSLPKAQRTPEKGYPFPVAADGNPDVACWTSPLLSPPELPEREFSYRVVTEKGSCTDFGLERIDNIGECSRSIDGSHQAAIEGQHGYPYGCSLAGQTPAFNDHPNSTVRCADKPCICRAPANAHVLAHSCPSANSSLLFDESTAAPWGETCPSKGWVLLDLQRPAGIYKVTVQSASTGVVPVRMEKCVWSNMYICSTVVPACLLRERFVECPLQATLRYLRVSLDAQFGNLTEVTVHVISNKDDNSTSPEALNLTVEDSGQIIAETSETARALAAFCFALLGALYLTGCGIYINHWWIARSEIEEVSQDGGSTRNRRPLNTFTHIPRAQINPVSAENRTRYHSHLSHHRWNGPGGSQARLKATDVYGESCVEEIEGDDRPPVEAVVGEAKEEPQDHTPCAAPELTAVEEVKEVKEEGDKEGDDVKPPPSPATPPPDVPVAADDAVRDPSTPPEQPSPLKPPSDRGALPLILQQLDESAGPDPEAATTDSTLSPTARDEQRPLASGRDGRRKSRNSKKEKRTDPDPVTP